MKTEEQLKEERFKFALGNIQKKLFWLILGVIVLIGFDVILVARFEVGPFLAIRTNKYKDGGSSIYYGLGYKVIKYRQIEGRYDTKLGFWNMNFIDTPTKINITDFAIEYGNNPKKTYKKYYGQYVTLTDKITKFDNQKKTINVQFTDIDNKGKYTLIVEIRLHDQKIDMSSYQEGDEITIVGTIDGYVNKSKTELNRIIIRDAFIKKEKNQE